MNTTGTRALGVVQRHQRHGVGRWVELIGAGDEHGALQEVIERRESHLAAVVDHGFRGAVDERADVLDPVARLFRPFGAQIVAVTDRFRPAPGAARRRWLRAPSRGSAPMSSAKAASAVRAAGRTRRDQLWPRAASSIGMPAPCARPGERVRPSYRRCRAWAPRPRAETPRCPTGFAMSLRYAIRSRISRRS